MHDLLDFINKALDFENKKTLAKTCLNFKNVAKTHKDVQHKENE